MKRVSETIESVGYLYAESAEEVYMAFAPSGERIEDEIPGGTWEPWMKAYRIRFIVEPVEQ